MSNALSILFLLGLYFIPTLIAAGRAHQTASVFVVNAFLGWTVIGWIVALAIAVGNKTASHAAPSQPHA